MSSPASPLPARPSLVQLRKQAKELLRDYRANDRAALARVQEHHPRITSERRLTLADAQLVVAREYGFSSWAKLKHHVESVQRPADFDEPLWGRATWPFLAAVYKGDETTVRQMLARDSSLARAEYAYLQPLHYAVRGGRIGMVRLLLDVGADPLAEGWSGRFGDEIRDDTPLARARDRELSEIVALLESAAGNKERSVAEERKAPSTPERELEDEMMRICHRGEIEKAIEMIDRHPGIAQAGLYEAVHQNHPQLVRILFERGAKMGLHPVHAVSQLGELPPAFLGERKGLGNRLGQNQVRAQVGQQIVGERDASRRAALHIDERLAGVLQHRTAGLRQPGHRGRSGLGQLHRSFEQLRGVLGREQSVRLLGIGGCNQSRENDRREDSSHYVPSFSNCRVMVPMAKCKRTWTWTGRRRRSSVSQM